MTSIFARPWLIMIAHNTYTSSFVLEGDKLMWLKSRSLVTNGIKLLPQPGRKHLLFAGSFQAIWFNWFFQYFSPLIFIVCPYRLYGIFWIIFQVEAVLNQIDVFDVLAKGYRFFNHLLNEGCSAVSELLENIVFLQELDGQQLMLGIHERLAVFLLGARIIFLSDILQRRLAFTPIEPLVISIFDLVDIAFFFLFFLYDHLTCIFFLLLYSISTFIQSCSHRRNTSIFGRLWLAIARQGLLIQEKQLPGTILISQLFLRLVHYQRGAPGRRSLRQIAMWNFLDISETSPIVVLFDKCHHFLECLRSGRYLLIDLLLCHAKISAQRTVPQKSLQFALGGSDGKFERRGRLDQYFTIRLLELSYVLLGQ